MKSALVDGVFALRNPIKSLSLGILKEQSPGALGVWGPMEVYARPIYD